MNERLLSEMKERTKETIYNNNERNKGIDRLNELKKDKFVTEYIKLTLKYGDNPEKRKLTEDEAIEYVYSSLMDRITTDSTNRIYLYLGTFSLDRNEKNEYVYYEVKRNDSSAFFRRYINIESMEEKMIPMDETKTFEKSNTVIVAEGNVKDARFKLKFIQKLFFTEAIRSSQINAIRRLKVKYRKISDLSSSDY